MPVWLVLLLAILVVLGALAGIRQMAKFQEEITALKDRPAFTPVSVDPEARNNKQRLIVHAAVVEVSDIPEDLEKNPYPDAFRLIRVEPVRVLHGTLPAKKLTVAAWAMRQRKVLSGRDFKVGDFVTFDLLPAELAYGNVTSIRQIDTMEPDFESPLYYESAEHALRMNALTAADWRETGRFRREVIPRAEFDHQREEIFQAYQQDVLPGLVKASKENKIDSYSLNYLKATDLFQPVYGGTTPAAVMVDFASFLESRGVDFLLVSIPSEVEVYPEHFASPVAFPQWMAPQRYEFLAALSDAGIRVVDGAQSLREAKATASGPLFMPEKDPHLSSEGCRVVAKAMAAPLRDYVETTQAFTEKTVDYKTGDHKLKAYQVQADPGDLYQPDNTSPIVLCGDSNLFWWQSMHCGSAGIGAHVAKELQTPIQEIAGAGLQPQTLRSRSKELATKKCVVYISSSWVLWDDRNPWRLYSDGHSTDLK